LPWPAPSGTDAVRLRSPPALESRGAAPTFAVIKTIAIVCGALILLLIVVALIVYLTLSNPGLLDFGLRDGVFRLAGALIRTTRG
jgi:hypothetical protein